jgi:hypothetical protein
MRLQSKVEFLFRGVMIMPNDLFDAPQDQALTLIDRDYAIPYNLEDPSKRSAGVFVSTMPDIPGVAINPTSAQVATGGIVGGTFSVTITSPGLSGTWIASKDAIAIWLTITSPTAPQTVDGSVTYNVAANVGGPRNANIYVNGKTFVIAQDGV